MDGNDELSVPALPPAAEPQHLPVIPRLSILHLMLWLLCSAVYLALYRLWTESQDDFLPASYIGLHRIITVIQSPIQGGVLTGAIVLAWNRLRHGPPGASQPGHWLLLAEASVFVYLPLSLAWLVWSGDLATAMTPLLAATVYVLPLLVCSIAVRRAASWSWRLLFGALVCLIAFRIGLYIALSPRFVQTMIRNPFWLNVIALTPVMGPLIASWAMIVLVVTDAVTGKRHDWLHGVGVGAYVANAHLTLLWQIGARFAQ